MPTATHRTSSLVQDVALLDLISAAAEAPDEVRERAHDLATTHQVAPPAQVERALAKILPTSDPYEWDRPASVAVQQAALDHAKSEQSAVSQERKKYYGGCLEFVPDNLFEVFGLFFLINVPFFFGLSFWILLALRVPSSLPSWLIGDAGLGLALLAMLPWGRKRKAAYEAFAIPNGQDRAQKARWCLDNLRPHAPTQDQMTQWLEHPEVSEQARTWIASPCGLMVQDAILLDARVKAIQATQKQNIQADLAKQLGLPA